MSVKHLEPKQWDAVDAGTPDQATRDHLASCEECRAVVAESRALLVGLRRPGHTQEPGQPLATDHPAAEDLAAYGDGVLFGSGARSIEEHLEHCSDCRDDIIVMRDIAVAGDLKETVSTEVRDQLLERLSRASQPERVRSLGEWLVKASRKVGAVFSPVVPAEMPVAYRLAAHSQEPRSHREDWHGERLALEEALERAKHDSERQHAMMEHAAKEARKALSRVEQILRAIAKLEVQLADVAPPRKEAVELATLRRDPVGPILELTAADVRLRIKVSHRTRPDVFTVTVVTEDDQPLPGVALEVRSRDGEPTLRTTDEHGQASFSLQRGESKLRLVRHGVWELQLSRQS